MKSKRFITLKSKIMLSTVFTVIGCFIIIGIITFTSLFNSLNEAARAEFLQISQKYAYSFESKIDNAVNYLSIISSQLAAHVENGAHDRETLQKSIFKTFGEYGLVDGSSVYFEANMYDGMDEAYVGTDYGTETSGKICWYFFKDGGGIAYLPEALENDIEFSEPHYTEAKITNKPIYTNPTTFEVDGKNIPMFTITYPIHNNKGEFIGAVTVDLFLNDIYAQLQEEVIYETGYVIISNDNNRVIYSPNYEDIGKICREVGLYYPEWGNAEGSFFTNGKSIITGGKTLEAINSIYISQLDSNFYISVVAPLNEINAAATRLMLILTAICAIVIAAIALFLYYLVGKLSAPINEITESVNKIAGGDISARVTGTYKGEFAVAKDSVNTMADSIETYIKESEKSLDILKSVLNNMDAYIYVSDPVTDEILFINDNMKRIHNIEGTGSGKICWQVLQDGLNARCGFCPCRKLDDTPGIPIVWEEYNTVTQRYYRNTDRYINWIDDKNVHLRYSVDITDIKIATISLDKRLKQQVIMASISQSFLSDSDIDSLIADALRLTGKFMGISQILYYKLEDDGVTFACQNEWINPETDKQTFIGGKCVLPEALVSEMKRLPRKNLVCLDSNDPEYKDALAPYTVNFQNYITVPIFVKGNLHGSIDMFMDDSGWEWGESELNLASLLSSLLSGVFVRETMELQLRRLSSIVESAPQYIACVTPDGSIYYANPALMDIMLLMGVNLQATSLETIFDRQVVREIMEIHIPKTIKDGTDSFELCMKSKISDNIRHFAFSSFTIGATDNIGCIVTDMTEIRALEAELIVAKELAEQGSRSKTEFLSRMSHEIRTPLNAIIGMNTLALTSDDPNERKHCHDEIGSASNHLLGIINDILEMSNIEVGKFELSYSKFNFKQVLMGVAGEIHARAKEKNQNLIVNLDPEIPQFIYGDEPRLSQIITNLLSNAVKFTPEYGMVSLHVVKTDENGSNVMLRIEIADNGIGISREQQKRLFNLFEQADGGGSRKFGGTGLGLAISKRFIELMGGRIWVESELGEGAKFIFTVKVKQGNKNPIA